MYVRVKNKDDTLHTGCSVIIISKKTFFVLIDTYKDKPALLNRIFTHTNLKEFNKFNEKPLDADPLWIFDEFKDKEPDFPEDGFTEMYNVCNEFISYDIAFLNKHDHEFKYTCITNLNSKKTCSFDCKCFRIPKYIKISKELIEVLDLS